MIGMAGAHRTGKSTLAEALAKAIGMPYRPTNMSEVFKRIGVKVNDDLDFDTRMIVQDEMLNQMVRIFSDTGLFTTDRTPLDIIAYTYLNVPRILTPEQTAIVEQHVERAFQACKLLPIILRVPPGITIVDDPLKAVSQPVYIETLDHIVSGLCKDPRVTSVCYALERRVTDLEDRVRLAAGVIKTQTEQLRTTLAGLSLH